MRTQLLCKAVIGPTASHRLELSWKCRFLPTCPAPDHSHDQTSSEPLQEPVDILEVGIGSLLASSKEESLTRAGVGTGLGLRRKTCLGRQPSCHVSIKPSCPLLQSKQGSCQVFAGYTEYSWCPPLSLCHPGLEREHKSCLFLPPSHSNREQVMALLSQTLSFFVQSFFIRPLMHPASTSCHKPE